jgi:hypothetical protein
MGGVIGPISSRPGQGHPIKRKDGPPSGAHVNARAWQLAAITEGRLVPAESACFERSDTLVSDRVHRWKKL